MRFFLPTHTGPEIQQASAFFPWATATGAWRSGPTPSTAEVNHLYSYNSNLLNVNRNPTRCNSMQLFTAKLLDMFRVSQHPLSGLLKTVTAASGTGHNTGTATSLQRSLIGQYYNLYRRLRLQFLIILMMGAVTPETCRVALQ